MGLKSESGKVGAFFQFLAGHLCCLAGFELSRLWSFFPSEFSLFTTVTVLWAFYLALLLATLSSAQGMVWGTLCVAWASTVPFPLLLDRELSACLFLALALLLSLLSLRGAKLGLCLLLSLVFCLLYAFTSLDETALGLFLLVASLPDLRSKSRELSSEAMFQDIQVQGADQVPRAEISWRGFAQLYAASAKGEGERFSGKVLKDTLKVVHCCGGVLESGSEHRGVYAFPHLQAREECRQALTEYGKQLDKVLTSVDAPSVTLIFKAQ